MFYYPEKFPGIVPYFEEVAPKIAADPQAFREYGDWARDELWAAFRKVRDEYQAGDQANLAFLIFIDERFSKLYCYRFWIVNYLFPDGPLHDYVVDNLKNLIRKFISVSEDVEDFEGRVVRIQRDLLQSDYADLYLQQALDGVKILELLKQNPKLSKILAEVTKLVDEHTHANTAKINQLWSEAYEIFKDDPDSEELRKTMRVTLDQVEMRSSPLPMYNMLTHTVEFRQGNIELTKRHGGMSGKVDEYKAMAKAELTAEEYELFELCYEQARNFSMYKDVMGEIDTELLPLWFGLHQKVKDILIAQGSKIQPRPTGPSAVIHHLVWYLPDELKAKVMTPDFTPFSLETV